jgi:hypothetical protein
MKKLMPLLVSVVLLGSTVACNKPSEQAGTTTNKPSEQVDTTANKPSKQVGTTANNTQNQQAIVPAGTTLDTIIQQDLSTGKNSNNERFTLKVKEGDKTFKDAIIEGHLEDVVKAARGKKASLHLVIDDIVLKDGAGYPIDATLVNTQIETKTKGKFIQNAGIILGGAVAGRFLGDKTKFKHGTLAGGTAATAFVLSSPGGEVVLKKGTKVKLKLKTAFNTTS